MKDDRYGVIWNGMGQGKFEERRHTFVREE